MRCRMRRSWGRTPAPGIPAAKASCMWGWSSNGTLYLNVGRSSGGLQAATAGGALPTGRWVQVAVTWDGTAPSTANTHLFINGVEQPKGTIFEGSGTVGYTNLRYQPLRIGAGSSGFGGAAPNAKFAYVALYADRLLTASELMQLDAHLPIVASPATAATPNGGAVTVNPSGPS